MPATINNGGDVLARGGVRATFRGPNVSQEKWDAIFGKDSGPEKNYSNAGGTQAGTASVKPGKAKRRKKSA